MYTPRLPMDELSNLMTECWEEKLCVDYRVWMNDFVRTDEELWRIGERDLKLLFKGLGLKDLAEWRVVELGCGVGRLIRAAAPLVMEIIGVDVSPRALELARTNTSQYRNLSFIHGNGINLEQIQTESVDLVFSFGVFAHLPYHVSVSYLIELGRILRSGGSCRLQMFVGRCTPTTQRDILAYRSYDKDRLQAALEAVGFETTEVIDVPVDGYSGDDGWLYPKIYALKKTASGLSPTIETLTQIIDPTPEPIGTTEDGSRACYLISVQAAVKYIECGCLTEAHKILSYAVSAYNKPDPRVMELLATLERRG